MIDGFSFALGWIGGLVVMGLICLWVVHDAVKARKEERASNSQRSSLSSEPTNVGYVKKEAVRTFLDEVYELLQGGEHEAAQKKVGDAYDELKPEEGASNNQRTYGEYSPDEGLEREDASKGQRLDSSLGWICDNCDQSFATKEEIDAHRCSFPKEEASK